MEKGKFNDMLCCADGLISEVIPISAQINSELSKLIHSDVLGWPSDSFVQSS